MGLQARLHKRGPSPYTDLRTLSDRCPIRNMQNCAGLMKAFKGQVVKMLRHPCGSRVINELYTAASTKQRRALCAEFYGREAVLFHEASSPSHDDIYP